MNADSALTVDAQSALAPASVGASLIDQLTLSMLIVGTLLFVGVMALLVLGALRKPRPVRTDRWLIGGGIVLPVVVLSLLLAEGLRIGTALSHDVEAGGVEVEVIARRWWWELRYRHPDGTTQVVTANELHLPLDCESVLSIATGDVIHSAWIPALAGKVDAIPGRIHRLVVHPTREGRFRGQCAEYCGTQHANMGLEVVVDTPARFREWLLAQAAPAREPAGAVGIRGREAFIAAGCATCHTIRGTDANGVLGPDLTHVASRRTLAAATLVNTPEALRHWLRSAQHVKPGNLMPSMPDAGDDAQLGALADYLAGLD